MRRLIRSTLILVAIIGVTFAECKAGDSYGKIRKLLSDADVTHPNEEFARLYEIGDDRIGDLIKALKDGDPEIRRRAQIVIRYLANREGMKALHNIYAKQSEVIIAGTVPVPLDDWDYQFIRSLFFKWQRQWSGLEYNYVFALMLDGSSKADELLKDIEKFHALSEMKAVYNIVDDGSS